MKIADVVNQMIEATSYMNGRKGVNVREIHDEVIKTIRPIAEAAGLECRSCWDINTKDGYGSSQTVIKYNVNLTEDKRYKNDRVGQLHNMMFHPAQPFIDMEDTVEEAVDKINYNNLQSNYVRLNSELAELLEQVEKYRGYIAEVGGDMNQLAAKLGYKK